MPNIGEAGVRAVPARRADRARTPTTGGSSASASASTRGEIRDALAGDRARRRPRRPAPPHARAHGPLPGLLLRRRAGARWLDAGGGADDRRRLGGGPAGLAAAVELRRLAASARCSCSSARRSRAGSRGTRSTRASACATCAARSPGPRYARRYARARAREAGVEHPHRDDGHGLVAGRAARAHRPARPRDARPGRRDARHRLPRAAALGAARARVAARGRDDDRDAPAARVPEGAPVGERALVVGAEHVSFSALVTLAPRRRAGGGDDDRAPRHQTLAAVPGRRRAALARPRSGRAPR